MNKGQSIIGDLNRIVKDLGDVYLNMADQYPQNIKNLENKMNSLNDNSSGKSSMSLDFLLKDIKVIVRNEEQKLNDLSQRDSNFLDNMTKELIRIKELDGYIDQIEDDSAELELISLNAMVTALKAGKNGGAFPYITEELQKVSKSSAKLSNGLKTRGEDLSNNFTSFLGGLNNDKTMITTQVNSLGMEFTRMTEITQTYQQQAGKMMSLVETEVKGLKAPLYKILEEVQKHDIVRQSIDHVILSLEHIIEIDSQELEEQLENLSYASRVYGFCHEILDEIFSELQKTYTVFKEKSDDLNSLIHFLKESSDNFKHNGSHSYKNQVEYVQQEIERILNEMRRDNIQDNVQKNLESVYKEIANLENSYSGFSRIINWVKTINISSRVEAAKLTHLENMGFIIENITSRTDSIENTVELIVKSINEFKKKSDHLFQDFFTQSSKDREKLDQFTETFKSKLMNLNMCSLSLENQMTDLESTENDFLNFYARSENDLRKMDSLINEVDSIMDTVLNKKAAIDDKLNHLLSVNGLDHWELKGDEIKKLIDKFTIYIHKKKADSSNSLEVSDEGASSGEITLF